MSGDGEGKALSFQDVCQALALLDGCAAGRARIGAGDLRIAVATAAAPHRRPLLVTVTAAHEGRFAANAAAKTGDRVLPDTLLGRLHGDDGDHAVVAGIAGQLHAFPLSGDGVVAAGSPLAAILPDASER